MRKPKKELSELFEKYSTDTCTKAEFDRFMDLVGKDENREQLNHLLEKSWDAGERRDSRKLSYLWYSAAAVILVLIGTFVFFNTNRHETGEILPQQDVIADELSEVSRVKLPDGSTVMLREGSWINMTSSFEGATREIALEGEAYFDISPDEKKPFIIHTGRLKTTVLGTAFSIKAFPNEQFITVTVTRGKVKVEEGKKLLATLEADKQLVYNLKSEDSQEKVVDAGKEVAWRSHDLIFRNTSFGEIVEELCRIYGVRIVFENEALKSRLITASLDDRDPIESVLGILCTAQRTYYIVEGDTFIIKPLSSN